MVAAGHVTRMRTLTRRYHSGRCEPARGDAASVVTVHVTTSARSPPESHDGAVSASRGSSGNCTQSARLIRRNRQPRRTRIVALHTDFYLLPNNQSYYPPSNNTNHSIFAFYTILSFNPPWNTVFSLNIKHFNCTNRRRFQFALNFMQNTNNPPVLRCFRRASFDFIPIITTSFTLYKQ